MKPEDEIKYNNWNAHLNNTRDRTNYAIRRMDLLIISISGGSIFLIFQILKTQASGDINIENTTLLKLSGLVFLLAIIANFISQLTGYYANDNEEKYTLIEIKKIEEEETETEKEINDSMQKRYDSKVKSYNEFTNILNVISIGLMFLGLIFLVYFNYALF